MKNGFPILIKIDNQVLRAENTFSSCGDPVLHDCSNQGVQNCINTVYMRFCLVEIQPEAKNVFETR